MFRFLCILSMLTLTIFLSGCVTVAQGPDFSEARAKTQPTNKATVYVFRKHAEPTAWGATVYFADRPVASLNEGGFTWAHLSPGKQTIRAVWSPISGQRDSKIDITVEAGKTYYVELLGVSQVTGYSMGTMYYRIGSGLNEVHPVPAEDILARCCKFQAPAASDY